MRNGLLTVVIPAYDEGRSVARATTVVSETLTEAEIPFEILFVDDGSNDGDATWEFMKASAELDSRVRAIGFSRNFGKEAAIHAGLAEARGDCVAVMDCDLQHPPEVLPEMYRKWKEGYDVVEGIKRTRGEESRVHGFFVSAFYGMMSGATGTNVSKYSDFKALDRRVVDEIVAETERSPFFRAEPSRLGFRTTKVRYDVAERVEGKSKWNFKSLSKYAVNAVTGYSDFPLRIPFYVGAVWGIVGLVLLIASIIAAFASGPAWRLLVVALLFGNAGLILGGIGIVGHYVGRTFRETQGRKRWIVDKRAGDERTTERRPRF